jgi:hypothetical protein
MPDPNKVLKKMLKDSGAVLVRRKRHAIWRLPNGKNFVAPKTPSDHRVAQNNIRDLNKLLSEEK